MKKRSLTALVTLLTISAARAADIGSTLHFNPSLSKEANPIVAVFGAGLPTLMILNFVFVTLFLLIPLFLYWRYPAATLPGQSPVNAREFISLQLYGRVLPAASFLRGIVLGFPFPRNRLQALRAIGFVLTWMVAFASFHAAFSWWAINAWKWHGYQQFRAGYSFNGYPLLEVTLAYAFGVVAAIRYARMEFATFLRQQQSSGACSA